MAVEFARTGVEFAGALEQFACELGDEPVEIAELVQQPVDGALAAQRSRLGFEPWVEFVQVSADPVLHPRALTNQRVAMIDQQPQLALRAVQPRHRQMLLAPGRSSDRERIDWV